MEKCDLVPNYLPHVYLSILSTILAYNFSFVGHFGPKTDPIFGGVALKSQQVKNGLVAIVL